MDRNRSANGVLIVDDNERLYDSLALNLKMRGFTAEWAGNGKLAEMKLSARPFAAVFLDLALGEENGIDILPKLLAIRPHTPVIIITGFGTFDAAVKATKMGAYDFLPKPLDIDKLIEVLQNAIGPANPEAFREMPGMVCHSPAMREICEQARLVADSPLPVLITGESGTGKELMAKYVHFHSSRREKDFISINCSAIADSLADSELFGHARGAFTGAAADRAGVFEQADGGSLHMDEVGDMSAGIQAKILRVLEDSKIRRVGENADRLVDIRLIASTNKVLTECIEEGTFRQDLFYRLNAVHLRLPPLRERREDIPALLNFFLERVTERGAGKKFSAAATELLVGYDWPGNIRELRNLVKICTLTTAGKIIEAEEIPGAFNLRKEKRKSVRLSDGEKDLILKALRDTGGNKLLAAQMLGISRRTLYNKLERYEIG
jgi:Response regulator containing CheY-like receiver, AAA-type ATPase, and DNA-binding domains